MVQKNKKIIRRDYLSLLVSMFLISLSACGTAVDQNGIEETATTYVLVRHAEKANDGTKDPVLTKQGQERAERLTQMLLPTKVDVIYSTNYQRTRQTVMPLAEKLDLEVIAYNPFDKKAFLDLQEGTQGKTVLIVGHSNTVPAMVNQLIGKEQVNQLEEDEYDKLFIVSIIQKKAKVTTLSY